MAKPPMMDTTGGAGASAMAEEPMVDEGADADAGMMAEEEPTHEVLLTVCKEADGTYRLIQGDEEDAAEEGGEATDDAVAATDEGAGMVYDSKGALMKGILDILNEDEAAAGGGEGSDEDNFQSGFGGEGAKPPAPAQKL